MRTVGQLLQHKGQSVVTISPDRTVLDGASLMDEKGIGALVVMRGSEVAGIFSERDLMRRVVVKQRSPDKVRIGEVMSSPVIACTSDTCLDEVRALLQQKHIRHIPVVDDGKLVGVLSLGDLNFAFEKVQEETIQYLEQYIYKP